MATLSSVPATQIDPSLSTQGELSTCHISGPGSPARPTCYGQVILRGERGVGTGFKASPMSAPVSFVLTQSCPQHVNGRNCYGAWLEWWFRHVVRLGNIQCLARHLKLGRRAPSVHGHCCEREGALKRLTWWLLSCVRIGTFAKTDAN